MNRRQILAGCALLCAQPALAAQPTRFSVQVTGAGTDVVLIPGLGSAAAVWDRTVAQLAPTHRVHALQVAGFAGLPAGPNAAGEILVPLAEEISAYIAAETAGAPAIAGHSLGGLLALMLGARHPAQASRLMIVDALPFYGLLYGPAMTAARLQPLAAQMRDQQLAMTPEAFAQNQVQVAEQLVTGAEDRRRVAAWGRASDPQVFNRIMYEDMVTDLRPDLPRIAAPITLLYPRDAAADPTDLSGAQYRAAYANAAIVRFVPVADSRHFIMLDQPDAFARAVTQWLA